MRAPGEPLKQTAAPTPLGERPSRRKIRYLAQAVALEETGNPFLAQVVVITISLIIVLFLLWAAVTYVDEVATATGTVLPSGKIQVVQHMDGGVVEAILVREGDRVEAGQPLIRLDSTSMRTELQEMQLKEFALSVQAQRLLAFANQQPLTFPPHDPIYAGLIRDQEQVYRAQVLAQEEKNAALQSLIRQKLDDIHLLEEQEKTLSGKLALLKEGFELKKRLTERGLSSRMRFLDAQSELNQTQGELTQVRAKKQQMLGVLEESRINLREMNAQLSRQALTEMSTVHAELAQVREALKRLLQRVAGTEITAKVAGIVQSLNINSPGGVIAPRAVILEIVPVNRELVVEAHISGRDVGHVKPDQPVAVKFTAYDFARYGGVRGRLLQISPTTVADERGEPYYRGLIALDANHVGPDPALRPILPGMAIQASIQTGHKTILEYLLKPIYASVRQALQER
ncbi:MAG: HlyD family type I secretion periplasmic adaptor subunit [Magnetococcales bacterium]|nr:HlyD family type I secretion periplasmic adaptor subunit [Magnetococcales bacterium]